MSKMTCQAVFREAMRDRRAKHPFERISAYKVRESRGNIASTIGTLTEIISVVSSGETYSVPILLGGCTTEDKAYRLKRIPAIIARELGYNLIPAIEALTVEGVAADDILTFILSIKERVDQLVRDCDAIQPEISRSIQGEYDAMKAGDSRIMRICVEALDIADLAVAFCERRGVL